MSTHAKLTGKHQYVEFKEETIHGRVKSMTEMRETVDSACAVKDEGCWSLKPGERILFEAH